MSDDSRIHINGLKPSDVALLKGVANEAAEQAVNKILVGMGLDPSKPFDAQKDMMWLRATRMRCEDAGGKITLTAITLFVTGAIGAAWVGFKAALK